MCVIRSVLLTHIIFWQSSPGSSVLSGKKPSITYLSLGMSRKPLEMFRNNPQPLQNVWKYSGTIRSPRKMFGNAPEQSAILAKCLQTLRNNPQSSQNVCKRSGTIRSPRKMFANAPEQSEISAKCLEMLRNNPQSLLNNYSAFQPNKAWEITNYFVIRTHKFHILFVSQHEMAYFCTPYKKKIFVCEIRHYSIILTKKQEINVVFCLSFATNVINNRTVKMDSKEQEYTRLIKEYKETIYTVCLMNSADQDEAKDLMQEALIQLWRSFGTFRGESDVRTWIYRICMNACISFMRMKVNPDIEIRRELA